MRENCLGGDKKKKPWLVSIQRRCSLLEKKRFFGCPTGGTFEGSLNGSKWVFRTIFRTFLGSLESFLVIYGTFLDSWTCKEPSWEFSRGF